MLNWLFPTILIAGKICSLSPVIPHQVHTKIEAVSVQDSLALVALYDSTNGPRWDKTWDKSMPVSKWHGVTVNLGNVTSVKLIKNKLKGRLPSQLGNLSKLKELTIVGDSIDFISGQIPESLWNINTLEVINFKFNKLTGFLSKSIAKLRLLDFAEFSYNSFEGTIPAEIGQLTQLRFLYLAGNRFIDTIPSTLAALSKLIQFSVEGNQLTGKMPTFFGDFKSLNLLHLHRNNFSGTIPAEYGNMTNLEECYLGLNSNVTGTIPNTFGNLTKLKILGLNDMNLSGTIPPGFGNLPALEVLYLGNNKNLGGAIPDELGNLTTLKEIDLSNCQFIGPVPASFSRLNLVQFSICNNDLTSLPIMNGVNIKTLCISRNQFTFDDLMAAFKSLPLSVKPIYYPQDSIIKDTLISKKEGETLTIDLEIDSTITGNVYKWYKSPNNTQPWKTIPETNKLVFSALKPSDAGAYRVEVTNSFAPDLTLQSRKITIQVRPKVDTSSCRYKDSLELIKLYNATNGPNWSNRWEPLKPISEWHGIFLNSSGCVTTIDLDGKSDNEFDEFSKGNGLVGNLPNLKLQSITRLYLSGNRLSGNIPNFDMPNLERLYLDNNRPYFDFNSPYGFTGTIPDFSSKKLVYLDVSNNQLASLSPLNLPLLEYLICERNKIAGTIPKLNLPQLKHLDFDSNQLTGTIPDFNSSKLEFIDLENNQLSGFSPVFTYPNLKQLDLSSNKFIGKTPKILSAFLVNYRLNKNQFEDLAEFGWGNSTFIYDSLILGDNRFTFSDILPFLTIINSMGDRARYSPQDSISRDTTIYLQAGQNLSFDLRIDAGIDSNRYQWYKDGQVYGVASNSSKLSITNLKVNDSGIYRVKVTNPLAPDLTLNGRKLTILVEQNIDTASCRYKDSLELVKLYNATNGSSWKNKWDLSRSMDKWYGVRLNDNGCVTCLDLDGDDNCNAVSVKGGNLLKGQIPTINLPELQYLFLRDNELSGPLPNFVLPKLESLVASNNKLAEAIPNLNLPKLRILWLNDNQFTGPIPNFNLQNLVSLVLTNNMLSGTIPNFNMPMLVYLRLSSNKLSGTIPNFSQLRNLLDLWLSNNELSGIIPAFSNPKLQTLILSRNKLQDVSPSFNLPQLRYLNLEQNQLKGIADYSKLPLSKDTIGEERGLRIMNNQLTFKDVIPNLIHAQKATFIYAPQARVIILDSIRNVLAGQTHSINLGIDESLPQDSPNTYFWEKDGKPFDTLIGVNRLVFPRLKISDTGWYTFRVINPKAPQLTLYGNKIRINVNCPPNANAIAIASSHASLCLGDTLKLSIDKKMYTNIRWNNGQTTPEIAPKLTQSATFSLTANDTLGCTNTGSRTIDVFNKPKLTLFQVTENCSDRLEPEVDGGSSPYRYTWSNNSNASTINLTTLGNYTLTVTDANNCKVTDMILVANLSKRFILKDSLSVMPSCNQADGTIWFTVSPKNQAYTYEWTPATMGQGQNPRTQLSPGQYKVLVRNSQGCIDSLTFNLQGSDCNDELRIFPAFTPNGDWVNETFEIRPINCPLRTLAECFPNNELIILNRSNHAIYQKSPYNNDWDGENYPVGSYYYVFYPDRNKQKTRMTGWLTLLR